MIQGRPAQTIEERSAVKAAMPKFGATNGICVYGYWDGDRCVGGAYLQQHYPHELVMEFYTHCPTIVKAISQSYSGMFEGRSKLTARILATNFKSLKMVRLLGFHRLYEEGGEVTMELVPQRWRYQKRYPLLTN